VIGVDTDQHKIDLINQGISPIFEPGLESLLRSYGARLSATADYDKAIRNSDVTFVVVPTPSEKSGGFSLQFVQQAMEKIGDVLRGKRGYHLIVLTSTVMPGSMENHVVPILEQRSVKTCGRDFGVCYNPEFIALGDVVKGLLHPDFILIGESDERAGRELARIQSRVCENKASVQRMNFVNAELAKISVNSFVTMKMSFANTLAEICENVDGADVDQITSAIGKDKRIGSSYLKGALGYGGPCFPRDNVAFATFARSVGAQGDLALTTHEINQRQVKRITRIFEKENLHPPLKVAVLGLTYKPGTNVTEASQALMLAQQLVSQGFQIYAYDPAITSDSLKIMGFKSKPTAEACIEASDVCVIATPWDAFKKIKTSAFSEKIVIDCWRILSNDAINLSLRYLTLGKNSTKETPVILA
jgi:UDPglucose 6-dehydrogenase